MSVLLPLFSKGLVENMLIQYNGLLKNSSVRERRVDKDVSHNIDSEFVSPMWHIPWKSVNTLKSKAIL